MAGTERQPPLCVNSRKGFNKTWRLTLAITASSSCGEPAWGNTLQLQHTYENEKFPQRAKKGKSIDQRRQLYPALGQRIYIDNRGKAVRNLYLCAHDILFTQTAQSILV